jgi:hypothetical protein
LTQDLPRQRMCGARRPLLTNEITVSCFLGTPGFLEGKQKGRSPTRSQAGAKRYKKKNRADLLGGGRYRWPGSGIMSTR